MKETINNIVESALVGFAITMLVVLMASAMTGALVISLGSAITISIGTAIAGGIRYFKK